MFKSKTMCKNTFTSHVKVPGKVSWVLPFNPAKRDPAKNIRPRSQRGVDGGGGGTAGGDGTTSRLLRTSISLHVAVSFVCHSKGR